MGFFPTDLDLYKTIDLEDSDYFHDFSSFQEPEKCHSFISILKIELTTLIFVLSWIYYGIFIKYKTNFNITDPLTNDVNTALCICSSLLFIVGLISYFKTQFPIIDIILAIAVLILSYLTFNFTTKIIPPRAERTNIHDILLNTSIGLLFFSVIISVYNIYNFIQYYSKKGESLLSNNWFVK
jgi:hypothetical protein